MVQPIYTEPGVYLDGNQGWHNHYRAVDLAVNAGMALSDEDRANLEAYRKDDGYLMDSADAPGAITDQGGLVDRATEYLETVTAPGLVWEWDAGELSLSRLQHEWEYGEPGSKIRRCGTCGERETYWDDDAYPDDPCPGAPDED